MHFLCLHGIGTNNQVFEVQTGMHTRAMLDMHKPGELWTKYLAALRYELGDGHTYEFVQGTVPWPMAPGLSSLFRATDAFYSYYDPASAESVQIALDCLADYLQHEGPFDGIIGFSQGASLAAMYLACLKPTNATGLKCAVFFSTVGVYDPVTFQDRGEIRLLTAAEDGECIVIPTVHIWGFNDQVKGDSEQAFQICRRANANSFCHDGGHEVPGLSGGDKKNIHDSIKAIRRGILHALME